MVAVVEENDAMKVETSTDGKGLTITCARDHCTELERAVVEVAVAYRRRGELKWESECIQVCNQLDDAIDALVAARQAIERDAAASSVVENFRRMFD